MTDSSGSPVQFETLLEQYSKEEEKLMNHSKFQEAAAKFWALLPKDENGRVAKAEYVSLMHRVYKVLLPHYKKEEMSKEILQEWTFDCQGRSELDYNLVLHVLFRVVHAWAVHIDYEEYSYLLNVLYDRISNKVIVRNNVRDSVLPKIVVTFPEEERKLRKSGENKEDADGQEEEEGADWEECDEDESPRSDFEYKYGDENDSMDLKRYKRAKNNASAGFMAVTHIKDPFMYKEVVEYDFSEVPQGSTIIDQLMDEEYVLPLGYPTEQYLFKLKNDVHDVLSQHKEKNKTNEDSLKDFNDPGDLKAANEVVTQTFFLFTNNGFHKEYTFCARILDTLYNNFRMAFRECIELTLRLVNEYPNINMRAGSITNASDNKPITEVSKVGCNPCLDRRIVWELFYLPKKKINCWINQMYIVDHIDIQYAFKSKISKIENKRHLVLKEEEGVRREEDFIPAETSYKKMLLFMLNKKFESMYSNRVKLEQKEQTRIHKQKEREEKKKKSGMHQQKVEQVSDPRVEEEQKLTSYFKRLVSKQGIIEDNMVNKNDLIIEANKGPLCILMLGKPKAGRTRVCADLAKSLDLVHVCVKSYIDKLKSKVEAYEPPEDLEEGQEPPKFLHGLEDEVHQNILLGKEPEDDQQVKILAEIVASPEAQTKGYVLDLPFHLRKETWYETIKNGSLNMTPEDISYIVELEVNDADIRHRARAVSIHPKTGAVTTTWDKEKRKKKKKKKTLKPEGEGEGDQEEEPEAEAEGEGEGDKEAEPEPEPEEEEDNDDPDAPKKPKPLTEEEIQERIKTLADKTEEELNNYNSVERPHFQKLITPLFHHQFVRLDAAGVKAEDLNKSLVARIKRENTLLRPIAIPLEAEGDNKAYLTSGKEDGELPRRWSLWKQTDPVALHNKKVVAGQTEFAASFNDRVFLFETEENQKAFCDKPKEYLNKEPEMPHSYRVLIGGPAGAGKKTVANQLSEKYGWRIVDWNQLVQDKIQQMRDRSNDRFYPNNPAAEDYKLGLSEEEWNKVMEGKPYDSFNFIPWFYEYMGFETEKRRPKPVPEGEGEGDMDEEAKAKLEEEERKKKEIEELKAKEKKKKEKKKKTKEPEPTDGEGEEDEIQLEDIPLTELDIKVEDEETLQKPFVGGFILIGFPQTAEHIEKLKETQIGFDKIIFLQDTDEETPGATLKNRKAENEFFDPAVEIERSEKILASYKENYEDLVNEISCNGTEEDVIARVYAALDPFFTQVDNEENVRTAGDIGEEEKPLPKGEYGDFCPVTLTNDSWLFPGSEEHEVQVFEKTYRLAGEPELELFKANPMKFVQEGIQHPPEPHILIIGPKGAGTTTQIEMICEKYKVPQFCLKKEFLKKLNEEKEERKKQRLLDRGFKAPEPVEDDDEEGPPPDPEIEDDPEDFDKEAHEKQVLREILDANSVLVLDGDWFDLPEDAVAMQLTDLLFDARRPPELVITLSVTEEVMLSRLLDNDAIEAEYQNLMDKLNAEKAQKRVEDRAAKLEELQADEEKTAEEIEEEMNNWDKDRDEEEANDDDPDAPNLETMLEEQKEKLVESRNTQADFVDEFIEKVTEKRVPVIKVDGNLAIERVNLRILSELRPYMELRNSMFERSQVVDLTPEEVKFYENSYLYTLSKYGYRSLFDIARPDVSKKFPLLYRDQLYFFGDADEKLEFTTTPDVFCKKPTVPKDVYLKPVCFVLGTPSCGKSTACESISKRTKLVHLKVEDIIPQFIDSNCALGQDLRDQVKRGQMASEELLIKIIVKRIQFADCIEHGYLLEDFPKTVRQAAQLAVVGIIPDFVFYLNMYSEYCYNRIDSLSQTEFMYDTRVFSERLTQHLSENPGVMSYYERHFGNIKYINGLKSKWYIEDTMIGHIRDSISAKACFARDILDKSKACSLECINIDRSLYNLCHSTFGYYCSVTWKHHKTFSKCAHMEETAVLYQPKNANYHNLYFFRNTEQRDIFIKSPATFSDNRLFPSKKDIPERIEAHNAAQVLNQEKNLANYCPVTLYEEEKVEKGYQLYLVIYNESRFIFETPGKLIRFLANPTRYSKVTLPVKMPPINEKITLLSFPELEDSVPFLEQSIGAIATRGLLEVTSCRLKYPTLSVKETSLKLFAMFLKANNPSNTQYTKKKYQKKIRTFVDRCDLPDNIYKLKKKKEKGKKWTEYEEKHYHELGAKYDKILKIIDQERSEDFINYIR